MHSSLPDEQLIIEDIPESNIIINELSQIKPHQKQNTQINISQEQESLKRLFNELIDSCLTTEKIQLMKQTYKSLLPKLNSIDESNSTFSSPLIQPPPPPNKKITPQRMFQPTKKRKTTKQNSSEDTQNMTISLILNHKNNVNK